MKNENGIEKSAILKGQTLVNYFNPNTISELPDEGFLLNEPDFSKQRVFNYIPLQPYEDNTEYTMIVWLKDVVNPNNVALLISFGSTDLLINNFKDGINIAKGTIKTISGNPNIRIGNVDVLNGAGATLIGAVILKGDYTTISLNSPFYGMQSVKMPILTTSNEDSTKSNILTVNEDITLRGIGDVQDTLDLVSGELTERIGEIVLDGSEDEDWSADTPKDNINRYLLRVDNLKDVTNYSDSIKCDKWRVFKPVVGKTENQEGIYINGWVDKIHMGVDVSRLSENSLNGFKQWLSKNPLTVQYPLATESIKTVDLSIQDQDNQPQERMKLSS